MIRNSLALLVLLAGSVRATVYVADSPALSDVAAKVALTVNGDTVQIPAGNGYWSGPLTITNLITLQGAGTNLTTIYLDAAGSSSEGELIRLWPGPYNGNDRSNYARITGLAFDRTTNNTGAQQINGIISVVGTSAQTNNIRWRIDHCSFNQMMNYVVKVGARAGLIDHNYFNCRSSTGVKIDMRIASPNSSGYDSWSQPMQLGTADEGIYLEANTFVSTTTLAATDIYGGGRLVFRYNTCTNASAENHGTESTAEVRGGRWIAAYGNTFDNPLDGEAAVYYRSGSGVVFSNSVTPGSQQGVCRMEALRATDAYMLWGAATGRNDWDTNDTTLYDSGTWTANVSGAVLTDTNKAWTLNQWENYTVSSDVYPNDICGWIISNTPTNMTMHSRLAQGGYNTLFSSGDGYEIRKVIQCIDQPGLGSGDLIATVNGSTTPRWLNQVSEPIYIWGNTGKTNVSNTGVYFIEFGRDYIVDTPHPSYTAYTYPHPLIAATESGGGGAGSTVYARPLGRMR